MFGNSEVMGSVEIGGKFDGLERRESSNRIENLGF